MQSQEAKKILILNLYRMAFCDGETDPRELDLLYRRAQEFGISESELAQYLISPTDTNQVPTTTEEQIFVLYHLAEMAHADGIIQDEEREFLEHKVTSFGFPKENAKPIVELLLDRVAQGVTYEQLLQEIQGN